ncbi:Histone-lysine N-methyltransferase SETMAR [Aphelenchoides besseyi]|nr:Histone-lysine N-methyltransferase SETMAR [Aphelenchoides besseyi]
MVRRHFVSFQSNRLAFLWVAVPQTRNRSHFFQSIEMAKPTPKFTSYETRVCLLYDFKAGLSATESVRRIHSCFGEDAVGLEGARTWFKKFRSGNLNIADARVLSAINAKESPAEAKRSRKKTGDSKATESKKKKGEHTIKVEVNETGWLGPKLELMAEQSNVENEW